MPRRTNEFQSLIAHIECAIGRANASVRESEFLKDSTGQLREVDVVIDLHDPAHPVRICVECVAGSRPANKKWVEEMWGKHANLSTDRLVLVSQSGFARTAAELAGKLGRPRVEVHSLREAERLDWADILHMQDVSLEERTMLLTHVSLVVVRSPAAAVGTEHFDVRSSVITGPDKTALSLRDFVHAHLANLKKSPDFENVRLSDGTISVTHKVPLRTGSYALDARGNVHAVVRVDIKVRIQSRTSSLPMVTASYGQVAVAFGSGVTPSGLGVRVVAAEARAGQPRLVPRYIETVQVRASEPTLSVRYVDSPSSAWRIED